jgi:tyrosyl-tRNA synthetase
VSAKLAGSKREARQFLADKAVSLNGEVVGEKRMLAAEDFTHGTALLKRGARNVAVLVLG